MLTVVTEKGELAYKDKGDIINTICLSNSRKLALVKTLEFYEENPDFPKTDVHFSEEGIILKFS